MPGSPLQVYGDSALKFASNPCVTNPFPTQPIWFIPPDSVDHGEVHGA
jgi:hypothetical protein